MLVTTEKKITETREISLPYHAKFGGTFFRINEDETIVKVLSIGGLNGVITYDRDSTHLCMPEVLNAEPCSAEEVERAARLALIRMEETIMFTPAMGKL